MISQTTLARKPEERKRLSYQTSPKSGKLKKSVRKKLFSSSITMKQLKESLFSDKDLHISNFSNFVMDRTVHKVKSAGPHLLVLQTARKHYALAVDFRLQDLSPLQSIHTLQQNGTQLHLQVILKSQITDECALLQ